VFNTEKQRPVYVRSSARISSFRAAPSRETGQVDRALREGKTLRYRRRARGSGGCAERVTKNVPILLLNRQEKKSSADKMLTRKKSTRCT